MKKLTLVFAVVLCFFSALKVEAQYYIDEGFETSVPPAGWYVTDYSSGSSSWVQSATQKRSGTSSAFSDYGPVAGDETWLVTNQVTVQAGDSLSFWLRKQYSSNYPPDSLTVWISTTDTNKASFVNILGGYNVNSLTAAVFNYRALSLNAYAGQQIYIAFRHYNEDGNGVWMDDVRAGQPAAIPDISITTQSPTGNVYYAAGTTSVVTSVTVTNIGGSPSPSVTVFRTISPGGFSQSVNVSPLNAGASSTLNFPAFSFTPSTLYTVHDTVIATGGETNFANNAATSTFTPLIAKSIVIIRIDQPSVDSLYRQLGNLGATGDIDTLTFIPSNGFDAWRTVVAPFASGQTWSAGFRALMKSYLDNSVSGPSKKTLLIFGNDLGYSNDPIRNVSAAADDTLFYRQYLRSKYIGDDWGTSIVGAGKKLKGIFSPFDVITSDSVADPYPDFVIPVNGGAAAFVPMNEDGTGDTAVAVYYGSPSTPYNMLYGTNVYTSYKVKSDGSLDNPTSLIGVLNDFINQNGGELPVELASFTSSIDNRKVTLNWSTVTEENNSGFTIERKLTSAAVWASVGNVTGAGNSNSIKNYSFTENNLATGKYNYRLKQVDFNGNFEYFNLSNEVNIGVPNKFALAQNYPNPFNPTTNINYDLPFDSKVMIKIFDITGREVSQLVNTLQPAGYHTINFNASALSSGVYFYQITADGGNQTFAKTMKMMLIK